MMPPPLPTELFDAPPPAVQSYIRTLDALASQVATLTARVAEREAKIGQNSNNSHLPPSSDGPHVKPAPPTTPSGKKRGGQSGHPKHERILLPADETHDCKPSRCRGCCAKLAGDDPDPIADQVIDLPEKLRHVAHVRRHRLTCPQCQTVTTADPVPGASSGFGPTITAATAHLSGVGRRGKRTTRTLFADGCDIPMSLGSVCKLEAKVSAALRAACEDALEHARGKDAGVDATGWKPGPVKAWLWVAVTEFVTVFLIRSNRNRASFDDLAGPEPGILTTDRFPVYTHSKPDRRRLCWSHLRRDFQAMIDRRNAGSEVGEGLLAHADTLFDHWGEVRDGTRKRRWFERVHAVWLRVEVRLLLERGAGCACAKTAAVCREMLKAEARVWTFAAAAGVEPTNNAAERAVRHAVCWRTTSDGTDSERGSRFVERMLTAVASCRSQSRDVLEFLTRAVDPRRNPVERLSLLPITV